MNLLKETMEALAGENKTEKDVKFVLYGEYYCYWEEFVKAADVDYDNGYGGTEVNRSLMIVGNDWWLERAEYDGSEWWEFRTMPTVIDRSRKALESTDLVTRYE